MIKIARADAYGAVLFDARDNILLCEQDGHFGDHVWTFPKGRPNGDETPENTALRAVLKETGYAAEILGVIPGAFPGRRSMSAYFLAGRCACDDVLTAGGVATRWTGFWEAPKLIGRTPSDARAMRDLAVLAAAQDARARLSMAQRPAAHKGDWQTIEMPAKRSEITLDLSYDDAAMAKIRKGYVPNAMEEKWFVWFDGSILHLHRSWTGFCVYQVRFLRDDDHWRAFSAIVNRDPSQYKEQDDDNDRCLIPELIDGWLLQSG